MILSVLTALAITFFLWAFTEGGLRLMTRQPEKIQFGHKVGFCLWNGFWSAELAVTLLTMAGSHLHFWHVLLIMPVTTLIYVCVIRGISLTQPPSPSSDSSEPNTKSMPSEGLQDRE